MHGIRWGTVELRKIEAEWLGGRRRKEGEEEREGRVGKGGGEEMVREKGQGDKRGKEGGEG